MIDTLEIPRTFVFFYEQVNKNDGSMRHINLGTNHCKAPKSTAQWQTMKLLEERCRTMTPWFVRMIGAMPLDMYERHKFANLNGPVYLQHYDNSN